jgi:hypothetical protein
MKIQWECCGCKSQNETEINQWLTVKDGLKFADNCRYCTRENDVDVTIQTK